MPYYRGKIIEANGHVESLKDGKGTFSGSALIFVEENKHLIFRNSVKRGFLDAIATGMICLLMICLLIQEGNLLRLEVKAANVIAVTSMLVCILFFSRVFIAIWNHEDNKIFKVAGNILGCVYGVMYIGGNVNDLLSFTVNGFFAYIVKSVGIIFALWIALCIVERLFPEEKMNVCKEKVIRVCKGHKHETKKSDK